MCVTKVCRSTAAGSAAHSLHLVPRLPRQQAAGVYHVTSRGNRGRTIFDADVGHVRFLALLETVSAKADWTVHAYCLMPNHYHLVVEVAGPTLSGGLQWLNGVYAQTFNRCHRLIGHLFQGRFHSVPVETDTHLLELARYLPLNPVRARLCDEPADWPWSSYRGTLGISRPLPFLAVERVLGLFALERRRARRAFATFVATPRL
jgi:putative transposase